MSWSDVLSLVLVILGIALFLYGSNEYDALSGFGGIGLFVFGILLYVALQAFKVGSKKQPDPSKA